MRTKKGRGRPRVSPILEEKNIEESHIDRMVRNYPKVCPLCKEGTYSAMCRCGRVTVINK